MLDVVRFQMVNKHGYICPPRYMFVVSADNFDQVASRARIGAGTGMDLHRILDRETVPEDVLRTSRSSLAMHKCSLYGAGHIRLTAREMVGAMIATLENEEV